MLYRLLRRPTTTLGMTLAATASGLTGRSFAAASAAAPSNFALDRNIFNDTLYTRLLDFWYAGLTPGASVSNAEVDAKWWGIGQTQAEKDAFDKDCRGNFVHALQAVGPDKYPLPAFHSAAQDVEDAETISHPFLQEVKDAAKKGEQEGADTLIALSVLFDQIPRNVFRDEAGLRLVYGHYDRIALTLIHASLRLSPSPVNYPPYMLRPVVRQYFLLPLMHSEHIPSHDLYISLSESARKEVEAAGDQDAVQHIARTVAFEERHQVPLRRFGRYPHRNQALGRDNTEEEADYMKTGETFGVKQTPKTKDGKSEL